MSQELTLFVGMFTTLLAIINPLEALPVFLKLLEGKDETEHRRVARLSCFYALLLAFFSSSSAISYFGCSGFR
jgi:multiple antibiotic resistance protein